MVQFVVCCKSGSLCENTSNRCRLGVQRTSKPITSSTLPLVVILLCKHFSPEFEGQRDLGCALDYRRMSAVVAPNPATIQSCTCGLTRILSLMLKAQVPPTFVTPLRRKKAEKGDRREPQLLGISAIAPSTDCLGMLTVYACMGVPCKKHRPHGCCQGPLPRKWGTLRRTKPWQHGQWHIT